MRRASALKPRPWLAGSLGKWLKFRDAPIPKEVNEPHVQTKDYLLPLQGLGQKKWARGPINGFPKNICLKAVSESRVFFVPMSHTRSLPAVLA